MHKMEGRDSRDMLNSALCDELLAYILCKACNTTACDSITLVCKRWKRVWRNAKWKLGLCMPNDGACAASFCAVVPSLLDQHPYISCLSMIKCKGNILTELLGARIVTAIASSCKCLRQLYFTAAPISAHGLEELSQGCPYLGFLELLQPSSAKCLPALCNFTSLQELSILGHEDAICTHEDAICAHEHAVHADDSFDAKRSPLYGSLQITKLSLINMRSCMSCDLRWLWRSCGRLQKLELSGCERVGDMATMSAFAHALSYIQELKLHRCRGIAGDVLALVSEHTLALKALTVHDGADTEGLRQVLQRCKGLELLDLRLPLDLSKEDLLHIGQYGKCLRSLRLHSCWMATGADMQSLASNINSNLEELVLVRCRAIFQDPGTLSSIGQSLANLRNIDVSENEYLVDKELAAMLAACEDVRNLNLWKCCRLTDKVVHFISQRCAHLESIDIRNCDAMSTHAVTSLLMGCGHLKKIAVEPSKLSMAARKSAFAKRIALV